MKTLLPLIALTGLLLVSCGKAPSEEAAVEETAASGIIDVGAGEASKLVSEKSDLVILDVRTPQEFAEGHLAGAVNIDFNSEDFASRIGELDPAKPYLVHCLSGGRSGKSLEVFEGLKFAELYHLNTGYRGWTEAGHPVEK